MSKDKKEKFSDKELVCFDDNFCFDLERRAHLLSEEEILAELKAHREKNKKY